MRLWHVGCLPYTQPTHVWSPAPRLDPWTPPGVSPECEARSKPWALPGVTQKENKITFRNCELCWCPLSGFLALGGTSGIQPNFPSPFFSLEKPQMPESVDSYFMTSPNSANPPGEGANGPGTQWSQPGAYQWLPGASLRSKTQTRKVKDASTSL